MKQRFVQKYGWLTENEMLDFVAIAQSAPGAMAINGAILVGYKLAGVIGVLVTVVATVLPPLGIITILAYLYNVFIKIAVPCFLLIIGSNISKTTCKIKAHTITLNTEYPIVPKNNYNISIQ